MAVFWWELLAIAGKARVNYAMELVDDRTGAAGGVG